jgi:hypothetical protein
LAQDRVQWRDFMNTVMNLHKESRIFLTNWVTINFSNNVLHHRVNGVLYS